MSQIIEERVCPICGSSFKPKQKHQVYCAPPCRKRGWDTTNREKRREITKMWNRQHPDVIRKAVRKWKVKNPRKVKAMSMARDISIGDHCVRCGSTKNLMKHHPDYSKALEVTTLCIICHKKVHGL